MIKRIGFLLLAVSMVLSVVPASANDWLSTGKGGNSGTVSQEQADAAWAGIQTLKPGDDQGPALTMAWVVINAINDPDQRPVVAHRLAALLADEKTTVDSKIFICQQLFRVGTAAEVPLVAPLLLDAKVCDASRLFLERVDSPAAAEALRNALGKIEGRTRIGIVNSLSLKQDPAAVELIVKMTRDADPEMVRAAWRALGNFGSQEVGEFFVAQLKKLDKANNMVEAAAIRCSILLAKNGNADLAAQIDALLDDPQRSAATRQAGIKAAYDRADDQGKKNLVAQWVQSDDKLVAKILLPKISGLDDAALEAYAADSKTSDFVRNALVYELSVRNGEKMLPIMLKNAQSDNPAVAKMALEFLAQSGDARAIDVLILALGKDQFKDIASQALARKPASEIGELLLKAFDAQEATRPAIVNILAKIKYYNAIDPLTKYARDDNPDVYEVAVEGLRGLCDPDQTDLSRLFKLYLDVPAGKQRDLVERAVAFVAEKNADKAKRAEILLTEADKNAAKADPKFQALVLPLLGRLGGEDVFARVDAAINSENADLAAAGVRALCNWPTADHAARLWSIVAETKNAGFQNQALRAYIRVVTLPNDRPEAETLAMLKKAFAAAGNDANRNLALSRAATVRTLDTVNWAVEQLDKPALSETACQVIVELAHHRFLRQPNKEYFDPILRKVEATAKDKSVAEQAAKARMGM